MGCYRVKKVVVKVAKVVKVVVVVVVKVVVGGVLSQPFAGGRSKLSRMI